MVEIRQMELVVQAMGIPSVAIGLMALAAPYTE